MIVDEKQSLTLAASAVDEQTTSHNQLLQDESEVAHELPPSYDSFENAYARWRDTDEAKQAIAALDNEPALAAAEEELQGAREVLDDMKKKSQEAFEALHPERGSFITLIHFRKSKQKSPQSTQINTTGGHSTTKSNIPTREEFQRAHELETTQGSVVQHLEEKVGEFKRKRAALNNIASTGDHAWMQLRRMADETLLTNPEFAADFGAATEKLERAENRYDIRKKTTTDLTRARLAVQNSHQYFTRALKICDSIRNTSAGRATISLFGGGFTDMDKEMGYRESVNLASKAQICLNEVFRVMESHDHMIPENLSQDYRELKDKGVMQMSKIYNMLFGGSMIQTGAEVSVKSMLERQEAAFAHVTHLAVWIQDRVPACKAEEAAVLASRDDIRREVAAIWAGVIAHGART